MAKEVESSTKMRDEKEKENERKRVLKENYLVTRFVYLDGSENE